MAAENSWKQEKKEREEQYPGPSPELESIINKQIDGIKNTGSIFDLYMSKLFDLFVYLLGGSDNSSQNKENSLDD